MNHDLFGIYDISIEVICDDDLKPGLIFPSLYAMSRGDSRGKVWHLYVHSVKRLPHTKKNEKGERQSLFMWPGLEIKWIVDPDGLYRASISGAELIIDATNKAVTLIISAGNYTAAERMGRLAYTEILRYEKRYMVHAGALEVDGQAVLILGPSGAGKSTMTTGLAGMGVGRFIAEDRCLLFKVGHDLMVAGMSDFLMLSESSRRLLQDSGMLFPDALERVKGKDAYNCHEVFLNISRNASPVVASFILSPWRTADDTTGGTVGHFVNEAIKPMETMAASKQILESGYYTGPAGVVADHFETMLCLADKYPVFTVPSRLHFSNLQNSINSLIGSAGKAHQAPENHRQHRSVNLSTSDKNLINEIFFAILSNTPADPALIDSLQERLSSHQWWTLCKIAEHHNVVPFLAKTLFDGQKGDHGLLPYLDNTLKLCLDAAKKSYQACLAFVTYLAFLLNEFKGQWCVVHGPAVAERFYRSPEVRPFYRLHLLVSPNQSNAVVKYLSNKRLPEHDFFPRTVFVTPALTMSHGFDTHRTWQIVIHDQMDTLCHASPGDLLDVDGALDRMVNIKTCQGTFPVLSSYDQALISFLISGEWTKWHCFNQLQDIVEIQGSISTSLSGSLDETLKSSVNCDIISTMSALARHIFVTPETDRRQGKLGSTARSKFQSDLDLLRYAALTPWEPASRRLLESIK